MLKQQVIKVYLQVYRVKQTSKEQRSEKIYNIITRNTNFKGLKNVEVRLHYKKLFVLKCTH